jgi:hypothetical protein
MTKKICSTCGSNMGLGLPSDENVKAEYECWCGNVEVELFTADELDLKRSSPPENQRESAASSIPA